MIDALFSCSLEGHHDAGHQQVKRLEEPQKAHLTEIGKSPPALVEL